VLKGLELDCIIFLTLSEYPQFYEKTPDVEQFMLIRFCAMRLWSG